MHSMKGNWMTTESHNLCVFTTGHSLDLLRESAKSVMITLHEYPSDWSDYVDVKLRKGIAFLAGRPEQYFLWVDGHDSLILKPEGEILARFKSLGADVLIAAERNCWPDSDLAPFYAKKQGFLSGMPRYINAGGIIGQRDHMLTAMHIALANATTGDDQRAWTVAYLADLLPNLQIDHGRRILSCVGDGGEALKADTCVMHFNGKTPGREYYWQSCTTGQF